MGKPTRGRSTSGTRLPTSSLNINGTGFTESFQVQVTHQPEQGPSRSRLRTKAATLSEKRPYHQPPTTTIQATNNMSLRPTLTQPIMASIDFSAPENQSGYGYSSFKGRQLSQDALDLNLTLITDPTNPTRTGNSTIRDTTPDLTFVSNSRPGSITWRNTSTDLGRDHIIIEMAVATDDIRQGNSRTFIWKDWEVFRKTRDTQEQTTADKITDIDSWTRTLRNDIKTSTKTIVTNIETPQMDSHLAHLI
ncbi:hypothetical protein HPB50_001502 [Hyalomma asiaticum]|uniref:Uncharacterized protein n=1 Tax=Hyalomma asiaticum TaxID=266040 RepID=A0ACB7T591_HYAAI|nr:hypothetical protein HPB50_001502 [Hyalomma asiaticum]